jgi:hypothetical protein
MPWDTVTGAIMRLAPCLMDQFFLIITKPYTVTESSRDNGIMSDTITTTKHRPTRLYKAG